MINSSVIILDWQEILPVAIQTLSPFHRELVRYVMSQPGKRRPSYKHALEMWGLGREQFDIELRYAYSAIRLYLAGHGLTTSGDLDLV